MDILWTSGVDWVIMIQSLGDWLRGPMEFFTFLGYEDFYLLILPLLYWSIDSRLGLRVGFILMLSISLYGVTKLIFAGPRPYWVSASVKAYSAESSFGVPSGHAQDAVSVWGTMAAYVGRRWAWIVAIIVMFMIGLSRIYLGVHFVHDVILGWLIGIVILTLFIRLWDPLAARISAMSMGTQIALAFAVSMIFVVSGAALANGLREYQLPQDWLVNAHRIGTEELNPVSLSGLLTSSGAFFGLAAGAAWINSIGGYQAHGPIWQRALRYIIGLVGVVILWMGLGAVFPRQEEFVSYSLRFFRYALVGFWVAAGAPWLFFRFKLAQPSQI
ncbi:MAG: phosphatase PAP2 family protein [Chloroflexota bacterium]